MSTRYADDKTLAELDRLEAELTQAQQDREKLLEKIEEMEQQGVVSPANHVGKREVLIGAHGDDDGPDS